MGVWQDSKCDSAQQFSSFTPNVGKIPWNFCQHSPEFLATFPRLFRNIPRNVWQHPPECLRTFPGRFGDISRNVWRYSLEYNIPSISRIPFPVPVFLVLYTAEGRSNLYTLIFSTNMIEIVKTFSSRYASCS